MSLLRTALIVAAMTRGALGDAPPPPELLHVPGLGPMLGTSVGGGRARAFLGIPYAQPPVGPLRWAPPVAARGWAGDAADAASAPPFNATRAPPGCPQRCNLPPHTCPAATSEDCLFLNVWAPGARAPAAGAPLLPVAVFIHGGQFESGFAGAPATIYDASDVAANTQTVWVHVNYRLGALGFLYLGAPGSGVGVHGNYGLQDQELALEWVRDHVAAFGGDPARVTLVGQSAGALAVAAHLARPAARGLFARAILQSPPLSLPFRDARSQTGTLAPKLAKAAGCLKHAPPRPGAGEFEEPPVSWKKTEACLRRLPAGRLVEAQEEVGGTGMAALLTDFAHAPLPFTPTVDTRYLPTGPLDALTLASADAARSLADVPLLLGVTAAEADLFVSGPSGIFQEPVEEFMYSMGVSFALGAERAGSIDEHYPKPPGSDEGADLRPHIARILSDGLFTCPVRAAGKALAGAYADSKTRASKAWLYVFDHAFSFGRAAWGPRFSACHRAPCHGTDLLTLFHPDVGVIGQHYTPAEDALSAAMQGYWGAFIRDGNPDNGTLPAAPDAGAAAAAAVVGVAAGGGTTALRAAARPQGAQRRWLPFMGRHKRSLLLGAAGGGGGGGGGDSSDEEAAGSVTGSVANYHGGPCEGAWDKHGYKLGG